MPFIILLALLSSDEDERAELRRAQSRSLWDVLHPGRPFAGRARGKSKTPEQVIEILDKPLKDIT